MVNCEYTFLFQLSPGQSDCAKIDRVYRIVRRFIHTMLLRLFCHVVDILPGLKSGASTSLTSLRPLGIEPNGRRSRCIPPLKRRVLANGLP